MDYVEHVRKAEDAIDLFNRLVKMALDEDTQAEDYEQIIKNRDNKRLLRAKD